MARPVYPQLVTKNLIILDRGYTVYAIHEVNGIKLPEPKLLSDKEREQRSYMATNFVWSVLTELYNKDNKEIDTETEMS